MFLLACTQKMMRIVSSFGYYSGDFIISDFVGLGKDDKTASAWPEAVILRISWERTHLALSCAPDLTEITGAMNHLTM